MERQSRGRDRGGKKDKRILRRAGRTPEVHCMLIPAEDELLLLPTSVMAEVVDFQVPRAMENAPGWLLGEIEWDNRQVPVFSFSALINGRDVGEMPRKPKIMVLKSLADSARVPYIGIVLSGLPSPVTVKADELQETGDERKSLGVFRRVSLGDNHAIVPDIDRLTHLVTHAAFGALPIMELDD
jgi:chemosensory pili system protein ChpC